MMADEEKSELGMLNPVDRLSNLPVSLVHHIISFLDTKEACRTSILSTAWRDIWATSPVLDFQPHYFINEEQIMEFKMGLHGTDTEWFDREAHEKYISFIETTIQKYSVKKLSVRKLTLEVLVFDHDFASKIDKWLGIAVDNHVEDFSVSIFSQDSFRYTLPTIFSSAKSLINLACSTVIMPYYEPIKFNSIRCLSLDDVIIEDTLLQHIINSCPLDKLSLNDCCGFQSILIPHYSKLRSLEVWRMTNRGGMINVESSSLVHLSYRSGPSATWIEEPSWACKIHVELRNLRTLVLCGDTIKDDMLTKLLSGVVVLEKLDLRFCHLLENIHVHGSGLKELRLVCCENLSNVIVDAPNLDKLYYDGDADITLTATNIPSHCIVNATIKPQVFFETYWFIRLKKFLVEPSICHVLNVEIPADVSVVEFDEEEADEISPVLPYKLPELRVTLDPTVSLSSLSDFVDGLLWSCRPDHLSVWETFSDGSTIAESLVELLGTFIDLLNSRAESSCCPLTHFEVGVDSSNKVLLGSIIEFLGNGPESWGNPLKNIDADVDDLDVELHFKLHW